LMHTVVFIQKFWLHSYSVTKLAKMLVHIHLSFHQYIGIVQQPAADIIHFAM